MHTKIEQSTVHNISSVSHKTVVISTAVKTKHYYMARAENALYVL